MKKTILIAHREESIREFFKKTLSWRFPLILTPHLQSIPLIIKDNHNPPRLLFLESAPDLSLDFIDMIRSKFNASNLILLSHPQNESHTLQGIRRGANGYILSPFHSQEIINLVR